MEGSVEITFYPVGIDPQNVNLMVLKACNSTKNIVTVNNFINHSSTINITLNTLSILASEPGSCLLENLIVTGSRGSCCEHT